MATSMADIIANYAMVIIDDIRLREQAQANPALFYRRMALYMDSAIPLFNRPPEVRTFLQTGLTMPSYTDYEWTSTEESTASETTVSTGATDYELFTCTQVVYDDAGEVSYSPYPEATYDSETGNVTFPVQAEAGTLYTMDFYKDGSFAGNLTATQKRILGFCVAYIWQQRFATDWLNMQPKIRDKSFEVGPEHAHITANTGRLREIRMQLSEELKKYEQDCAYYDKIKGTARNTTLL